MGLPESLNTEQAIVSSLRHNDLIKLHLEEAHETSLTKKQNATENTMPQCRVCSCSFINRAGSHAEIVCWSKR